MGLVSGGSDFSTKNQPATKENAYGGASSAGVNIMPLAFFDYQGGQRQAAAGGDAAGRAMDKALDMLPAFDKSICDD